MEAYIESMEGLASQAEYGDVPGRNHSQGLKTQAGAMHLQQHRQSFQQQAPHVRQLLYYGAASAAVQCPGPPTRTEAKSCGKRVEVAREDWNFQRTGVETSTCPGYMQESQTMLAGFRMGMQD